MGLLPTAPYISHRPAPSVLSSCCSLPVCYRPCLVIECTDRLRVVFSQQFHIFRIDLLLQLFRFAVVSQIAISYCQTHERTDRLRVVFSQQFLTFRIDLLLQFFRFAVVSPICYNLLQIIEHTRIVR